jgi:hypothetical protein
MNFDCPLRADPFSKKEKPQKTQLLTQKPLFLGSWSTQQTSTAQLVELQVQNTK